jgi:hypothetical protein
MEQAWVRLRIGSVSPGHVGGDIKPLPRTFFGLASQRPHIELGVPKATEINSVHVVAGRW